MSTGINRGSDWHEIADHTIILRGNDESASLTLSTNSVLGKLHAPSAIAFDARITLPRRGSSDLITFDHRFGCYGSIFRFADALRDVREGRQQKAVLEGGEGFDLAIVNHPTVGACVHGSITSPLNATFDPFPDADSLPEVFEQSGENVAHSLRFAFQSSIVDPPLLNSFIRGINDLICHLKSFE